MGLYFPLKKKANNFQKNVSYFGVKVPFWNCNLLFSFFAKTTIIF